MRDFMKGGLFCLFIAGMGTCALAGISGAVVILVEAPLFGTRQFEMLFAMAMAFWTGLASSVLSAAAYAALDYIEQKFSSARGSEKCGGEKCGSEKCGGEKRENSCS
ncbi:MAG TPA: hypothetical protein VGN42_06750 [Pirellulales bacterium]|jgi:hypothetical protein|nr:hypothetical protein [Pirellulales bacterium]